jgi:poly(A) polymerase
MTVLRNAAEGIVRRLRAAGFEAVFAGGCVRDRLLGLEPSDYDIATSARPEQVEALFERTIPVGKQFGIVIVVVDGGNFEVATFREDGPYVDGRRPASVHFSDARSDALRRDFTINAMFEILHGTSSTTWAAGPICGGPHSCVGDADARRRGSLRMIVPCFATRFGFTIDPDVGGDRAEPEARSSRPSG